MNVDFSCMNQRFEDGMGIPFTILNRKAIVCNNIASNVHTHDNYYPWILDVRIFPLKHQRFVKFS